MASNTVSSPTRGRAGMTQATKPASKYQFGTTNSVGTAVTSPSKSNTLTVNAAANKFTKEISNRVRRQLEQLQSSRLTSKHFDLNSVDKIGNDLCAAVVRHIREEYQKEVREVVYGEYEATVHLWRDIVQKTLREELWDIVKQEVKTDIIEAYGLEGSPEHGELLAAVDQERATVEGAMRSKMETQIAADLEKHLAVLQKDLLPLLWDKYKVENMDEAKAELKVELTIETKKELKEDLRAETKKELKKDLEEETKQELKEEMRESVENELKEEMIRKLLKKDAVDKPEVNNHATTSIADPVRPVFDAQEPSNTTKPTTPPHCDISRPPKRGSKRTSAEVDNEDRVQNAGAKRVRYNEADQTTSQQHANPMNRTITPPQAPSVSDHGITAPIIIASIEDDDNTLRSYEYYAGEEEDSIEESSDNDDQENQQGYQDSYPCDANVRSYRDDSFDGSLEELAAYKAKQLMLERRRGATSLNVAAGKKSDMVVYAEMTSGSDEAEADYKVPEDDFPSSPVYSSLSNRNVTEG